MTTPESPSFLDHFPRHYRGRNGRFFYEAIRSGAETDSKVCSIVYRAVWDWLTVTELDPDSQESWREFKESWREFKRWLEEDRAGALAFACWCREQENADPAEREAAREKAAADGKREWMREQEPTDKQLALLKKLGHTGEVRDRLEASELIEKLKTW
jgi:hypothetical protein